MTGFGTVPDAVRAAGTTVGDATAELRDADCGTPVGELSGALPGSASAGAATTYEDFWQTDFGRWCTDASDHAQNLTQAAVNYGETENTNTTNLSPGSANHGAH